MFKRLVVNAVVEKHFRCFVNTNGGQTGFLPRIFVPGDIKTQCLEKHISLCSVALSLSYYFTNFVVRQESPNLGRSNLVEIIRKTRNMFKNFRFCGKRKNCSLQLISILKRLTLTRLEAFTSQIVTFKILTQVSPSYGSPFFIFFLLPSTGLAPSGDENLFHQSRWRNRTFRPISFHRPNSWR